MVEKIIIVILPKGKGNTIQVIYLSFDMDSYFTVINSECG